MFFLLLDHILFVNAFVLSTENFFSNNKETSHVSLSWCALFNWQVAPSDIFHITWKNEFRKTNELIDDEKMTHLFFSKHQTINIFHRNHSFDKFKSIFLPIAVIIWRITLVSSQTHFNYFEFLFTLLCVSLPTQILLSSFTIFTFDQRWP